jgi:hypothetical protein
VSRLGRAAFAATEALRASADASPAQARARLRAAVARCGVEVTLLAEVRPAGGHTFTAVIRAVGEGTLSVRVGSE